MSEEILIYSASTALWTRWLALGTFIMAGAVVAAAVIAVIAIRSTKNIEKHKIELKRKSLAKNLLFEVRDNNYSLEWIDDYVCQIKNNILTNAKLSIDFDKVIYANYINTSIALDFNQEELNPLLREYYKLLEMISKASYAYDKVTKNNMDLSVNKFNVVKNFLLRVVENEIKKIRSGKKDKKLIDKLQKEANLYLEEKGYSRKYERECEKYKNFE